MTTSKTRTTIAIDPANPLPPVGEDLAALRAQQAQDEQATAQLIDQLHSAHKGLAQLAKRVQGAEHRREAEVARIAGLLASEKLAAEALAADNAVARDRLAAGVDDAAHAIRALAQSTASVADPLLPLIEGDDAGAWEEKRERLAKLTERQAATGDAEALAAAAGAVKDLIDAIAARAKVQSNRVQLLRSHVDELEGDAATRSEELAGLKNTLDLNRADLGKAKGELDETRRTCGVLGEDLDLHKQKLARTTTASLEKEAQLLREREQLEKDLAAARGRGDDLNAKLRDLTGLLRKAERCGADLVRVLVDLADADLEAPLADRLPALQSARDELAELSRDAANAMDDEIDGLFRQDIGEDIAAAARGAGDAVAARRRALAEQARAAEAKAAELAKAVAGRDQALDEAGGRAAAAAAERDRLNAQLAAAKDELDARARELGDRAKESTALKADLAKGQAAAAELAARLDQAKAVRGELDAAQAELAATRKELEATNARAGQLGQLQAQLARELVDLASAADGSLAIAGLKSEGAVSRLTRTVTRLEGETGRGDPATAAKAAIEVVGKLGGRFAQLGAELTRRGEALEQARREREELERRSADAAKAIAAKDEQIRLLTEEVAELQQQAKRGATAAERLAQREQELAAATAELARLKEQSRQAMAAVEELRARGEDTAATLGREHADLRRKLGEEQKARRAAEAAAAERTEQAESQLATTRAKAEQLTAAIEERDERLATLRSAQDDAAEARAHANELQAKIDTLARELGSATDRARRLEAEADNRPSGASSEDLSAARAERDAALGRIRVLERKLADEGAAAASLKAQTDGLRRKLEEHDAAHRSELSTLQERHDSAADEVRRLKEKLAGLQAKVRTLTSV